MNELKNRRVLDTLYKTLHQVMLNVVEDDSLGTIGEDFKKDVNMAEASSNILALKIEKKG